MDDPQNLDEKGPALPADLLAQGAALDAGAAPVSVTEGGAVVAVPAITPEKVASDVQGFLVLTVQLLSPVFPKLAAVWTDDACKNVATAAAPVLIKHNWVPDFGAWGPEIMLAITVLPLLKPTADALKLKVEKKDEKSTDANAKAIPGVAATESGSGFIKPASTEGPTDS